MRSSNRLVSLTSLWLEIYQEFQCKHFQILFFLKQAARNVFIFFMSSSSSSCFGSVLRNNKMFFFLRFSAWKCTNIDFFCRPTTTQVEIETDFNDKRDSSRDYERGDNDCRRRKGILSKYVSYCSIFRNLHKQLRVPINDRVLCFWHVVVPCNESSDSSRLEFLSRLRIFQKYIV